MLGRGRIFGRALVFICFIALFVAPMAELSRFAFLKYHRVSATFVYSPIGIADIVRFTKQPEFGVFIKLINQTLLNSLAVFIYSLFIVAYFLFRKRFRDLYLISLLLSLCFVVPAILKSYSWYQVMSSLPFWEQVALPAFLSTGLAVFYSSAVAARMAALGSNVILALDEIFYPARLVLELLKFSVGPALFAAICVFAVTFFSGIEIQHLGRNVVTFGNVIQGFWGGREQEAGFFSLFSFAFIVISAWASTSALWRNTAY